MTLTLLEQLVMRLKALLDVVPAGANIVTLAGSQTLTNKTLTAPAVTAPAITGATTIGTGATITTPTITPAGWTSLTLQNSWVDHGGYGGAPDYRKLPDGTVELRGGVKNGVTADGTTVTTLPAGNRPLRKHLSFQSHAGGGTIVEVNTDGTVKIYNNPGAINNAELALSGICFPTS